LQAEKERLEAMPEKEQVQISRDFIGDRMAWLQAESKKMEAMPEKEQVQVSRDLIAGRLKWIEEEKRRASEPSANKDRIDRLHWLKMEATTDEGALAIMEELAIFESKSRFGSSEAVL
jgi:hypothetical protein